MKWGAATWCRKWLFYHFRNRGKNGNRQLIVWHLFTSKGEGHINKHSSFACTLNLSISFGDESCCCKSWLTDLQKGCCRLLECRTNNARQTAGIVQGRFLGCQAYLGGSPLFSQLTLKRLRLQFYRKRIVLHLTSPHTSDASDGQECQSINLCSSPPQVRIHP